MTANLAVASTEGRWDIYGPIHKALRLGHTQLLTQLGSADFTADQTRLLGDLRNHLAFGAGHLAHEEDYLHGALEARAPGATAGLEAEHAQHRLRFEALESAIADLLAAAPARRPALGRALYLQFSTFVAEDLLHMAEEETVIWPTLCAVFTDEELGAINRAIVASLKPEQSIASMRLMLPAMNRNERIGLLTGMKLSAPPEAYKAVIELAARPNLKPEDFAVLREQGLAA